MPWYLRDTTGDIEVIPQPSSATRQLSGINRYHATYHPQRGEKRAFCAKEGRPTIKFIRYLCRAFSFGFTALLTAAVIEHKNLYILIFSFILGTCCSIGWKD